MYFEDAQGRERDDRFIRILPDGGFAVTRETRGDHQRQRIRVNKAMQSYLQCRLCFAHGLLSRGASKEPTAASAVEQRV